MLFACCGRSGSLKPNSIPVLVAFAAFTAELLAYCAAQIIGMYWTPVGMLTPCPQHPKRASHQAAGQAVPLHNRLHVQLSFGCTLHQLCIQEAAAHRWEAVPPVVCPRQARGLQVRAGLILLKYDMPAPFLGLMEAAAGGTPWTRGQASSALPGLFQGRSWPLHAARYCKVDDGDAKSCQVRECLPQCAHAPS